ncbi:hypothetical protein ACHQM5_030548 [Ranunculus cassubicifolius]
MAPRVSLKSKGKSGKGKASSEECSKLKCVQEWTNWALKKGASIMHVGFIPFVIFVGMNSEPKPTITQLLSPM